MMELVAILIAFIPGFLLIVLAGQCFLALLPLRPVPKGERGRIAVLIPAHNEALMLSETLARIQPQLKGDDRICVVADNCSDETAQLARQAGVEVVERFHETDRGKGFALAAGMHHLAQDSERLPEVVVVVDADCRVEDTALDALVRSVDGTGRPVQALYLMDPPDTAVGAGSLVSAFAFLVKNWVRPRGMHRIGQPVPLTGTGMAFPWELFSGKQLANGDIVEDMTLGVDLMAEGRGAVFLEEARVYGALPASDSAAVSQRTRWEHGHLKTILRYVPRLLSRGRLLPALDLIVPPLALLAMLGSCAWCVLLVLGLVLHVWVALVTLTLLGCAALLAIVLVWSRFGKQVMPAGALLAIPAYVLGKIGIYGRFIGKRQTSWVRTARDGE